MAATYVPLRGRLHVFGSGEQHFVMPGVDDERVRRTPAGLELALPDALAELERQGRRCLFVVGGAGAGKTAFLQALCGAVVRDGGAVAGRPVWHGEVATVLATDSGAGTRAQLPANGYILLDGFDRIKPEAARVEAVRTLEAVMVERPEARFVVASRPSALSSAWLDDRFLEVRLCALDGTERARLIERCSAASDGGDADAVAVRLTEACATPAGAFLARTPLVVRALCERVDRDGTLPGPVSEWVEACALWADERRDLASTVDGLRRGVEDLRNAYGNGREALSLIRVRGGSFPMGSPDDEAGRWSDEGPVHTVTVPDFLLAPLPVMNHAYGLYLAAHPDTEPPPHWGDPAFSHPDQPVVGVEWEEARRYAAWAGGRLPTEAEWEYACRAGTSAPRYGDIESICWYRGNSGAELHPVGQKEPNAWGFHDMLGNAWEWVEDDFHAGYAGAPDDGQAWCDRPRRTSHVLRGGSWADASHVPRAATRLNDHPGPRIANVGFRLARSLHP
ncbi:MAG: SUMF1/EgtB/PvdO family nonheme iron enzyme [Rhodothermales bacterium]